MLEQSFVNTMTASDLKDMFIHLLEMGATAPRLKSTLKASFLDTPLGPMIAIASETALYLLEFIDQKGLERAIHRLIKGAQSTVSLGVSEPLLFIEQELKDYFSGQLVGFKTPLFLIGSVFQKQVWEALKKIPCGSTRTYFDIATSIDRPSSTRAVANANGANPLAIIIPCHRVIRTDGGLGGYAGGISRKEWLIDLEKQPKTSTAEVKQYPSNTLSFY